MHSLKPGRYRHFKGNEYQVLGVARDAETLRSVVVYRALFGEQSLWVRSVEEFQESIERDGARIKRFEFLGE
ncbi:MAG: DUF1653 domain-containing protein [Pseudomonadota bacterium]